MFGMKCCWFCLRLDRHLARSMRKLKVGHCSRSTSLATPSASHEQWSPSVMTRWDFWHSRLMKKVTFWDFEAFWIKRALGWRKIFLSIRSLWVLGGFWKYLFRIRSGVMPILTRWGFNGFHVCGAKSCFLMMGRGGVIRLYRQYAKQQDGFDKRRKGLIIGQSVNPRFFSFPF